MKRLLTWGFVAILVMGTAVSSARAGTKSPVRGHWSVSGVIQIEPVFGGAPATVVGVLTVDDSGGYTEHVTVNSACTAVGPDCPASNPLELDVSGTVTANEDGTGGDGSDPRFWSYGKPNLCAHGETRGLLSRGPLRQYLPERRSIPI
jgi:hypothetical protein